MTLHPHSRKQPLFLGEILGIQLSFANESRQERVEALSRSISGALQSPGAPQIADRLSALLKGPSRHLRLEDRVFIRSFLYVYHLQTPTHLAVAMHLYKGHLAAFDISQNKPDILGARISQLQELSSVNPRISWDIFLVADGGYGLKAKGQEFIANRYPAQAEKIHVSEVDPLTLAKLHSFKGAPIIQGLRQAVELGADAVTFPDFYTVPHLAQLGNLLEVIQSDGNPVAIGSRRLRDSIIYKAWFRRLSSLIFNKWVWLQAPELIGIHDTQTPLKLYPRKVLKDILPVDAHGQFDPWFDYGLSFDVELLRRAVRKGYQLIEIPSLDVLQMSARPSDHFILNQSKRMAATVSMQKRRWEPFHQVFQIFATGGESYILGHPSLDLLVKIPRYYQFNLWRSLVRVWRRIRNYNAEQSPEVSSDSSHLLKLHKTMGLLTADTSLGALLQRLFMWKPLRPVAHTFLALAESERGESFSRVDLVRDRLEGLVVPFDIKQNIEISVLMPFPSRVRNFLAFIFRTSFRFVWQLIAPLRHLLHAIWRRIDPLVRLSLSHLIRPWAARLFIWFWSEAEAVIIEAWQDLISLSHQLKDWLFRFTYPIWRKLWSLARWIWSLARDVFLRLRNQFLKLRDYFAMLIQRFLDWTGLGELIRLALLPLRPLTEALFRLIHWLGQRLHFLLRIFLPPYEHIVVTQALTMERAVTVESLLPELHLQEGQVSKLIDRYIELQKELWQRGAFNRDTNILEDSGLDSRDRLVLVDFTEVVFSRQEANEYLEANSEFIPRFHFRIFKGLTSPEDLEYYLQCMRSLYRELLSPAGQAAWGTIPGQRVNPPEQSLPAHEYSCNSSLCSALNKWHFFMNDLSKPGGLGTATYLPLKLRSVPAAILERALNEAPPARRELAEEIVNLLGCRIGEELAATTSVEAEYDPSELFAKLSRQTRRVVESILVLSDVSTSSTKWERSKTALLLQRAIETGSGRHSHLKLPNRNTSAVIPRANLMGPTETNAFDNNRLAENTLETPEILMQYAASEPFVLYSLVKGRGSRLGLLSLQNTKPEVRIFSRSLIDYSRDIAMRFFPDDPQAARLDPGWIILASGDNLFLPGDREDFMDRPITETLSTKSVLLYFDMLPEARSQNSFLFWLCAGAMTVFEQASRYGPGLSHLIRQWAANRNDRDHIQHWGGSGLPGVLLLRPIAVKALFEQLRGLAPREAGIGEFHRDLILPFKVSLTQWEWLWQPDFGIDRAAWTNHWRGMQKLKHRARTLPVVYGAGHVNVNSSRDVYNIYQAAVDLDSPFCREQVRCATGLPLTNGFIDSEITGQVIFEGAYLLFKSRLRCSPGIRLRVEGNLVLDDTEIQFIGPPGDYVIPRGTVIAHSRYHGTPTGDGPGGFWYRVDADEGQNVPFLTDTVTTTLTLPGGQRRTGSLPMDFDVEKSGTQPLEQFSNLSLAELRSHAMSHRGPV